MANLIPWRRRNTADEVRTGQAVISMADWAAMFDAWTWQRPITTLPGTKQEEPDASFAGMVQQAYRSNGIVFACVLARMLIFSEAEFTFKDRNTDRLFPSPELAPLQAPWVNGSTRSLLKTMMQYADLGGNAYVARRPGRRLMCLRPDWVEIVIGSRQDVDVGAWDVDSEVLGYVYWPGGKHGGKEPYPFLAETVAHWAPIPDPQAQFRGMSWMTPVVREVMADKAATEHKQQFFENAATPNMVVKLETDDLEKYKTWIELFKQNNEGGSNAYRTLFLGAGADATPVGANFEQMDFRSVQGAGETRIAAAARIPPIIVGFSEGLAAATYSNYGQARRAFGDATIRPLWGEVCEALETVVSVPSGSRLWYRDSHISFLREDQKDQAQITSLNAISIRQLVDGGFEAPSVIEAVTTGDLGKLKHTGLVSVQLLPASEQPPNPEDNPDANVPAAPPPAAPAKGANGNGGAGTGNAAEALAAVKGVLALNAGPDNTGADDNGGT